MTEYPVARTSQLRAGDIIAVVAGELQLVLGRDGDRYFAMQRNCLHQGGDLADGIVSRGHIVCPVHGWRFSTETGCHETASYCLQRYPVRIVDDQIFIEVT